MTIVEALLTLAPYIAKLIESMTSDSYDQEAEKQALLDMERAISDVRAAKALA
jgi:hypothetical protein